MFFFLYILFPETKNKTLIFLNLMITFFFLQEVWKTAIHSGAKKNSSSIDGYLLCSAFVVVVCKCALK